MDLWIACQESVLAGDTRLGSGSDHDSDRPWPDVGSKDSTDLADHDLGSGSDPASQGGRQSLSGVAAVKVVQSYVDR